jgi:hypothetical protein
VQGVWAELIKEMGKHNVATHQLNDGQGFLLQIPAIGPAPQILNCVCSFAFVKFILQEFISYGKLYVGLGFELLQASRRKRKMLHAVK